MNNFAMKFQARVAANIMPQSCLRTAETQIFADLTLNDEHFV